MLRKPSIAVMALTALGIAVLTPGAAFSATIPAAGEVNTAKTYFDLVFAELSRTPIAINTPANREKLRSIGWSRLDKN